MFSQFQSVTSKIFQELLKTSTEATEALIKLTLHQRGSISQQEFETQIRPIFEKLYNQTSNRISAGAGYVFHSSQLRQTIMTHLDQDEPRTYMTPQQIDAYLYWIREKILARFLETYETLITQLPHTIQAQYHDTIDSDKQKHFSSFRLSDTGIAEGKEILHKQSHQKNVEPEIIQKKSAFVGNIASILKNNRWKAAWHLSRTLPNGIATIKRALESNDASQQFDAIKNFLVANKPSFWRKKTTATFYTTQLAAIKEVETLCAKLSPPPDETMEDYLKTAGANQQHIDRTLTLELLRHHRIGI